MGKREVLASVLVPVLMALLPVSSTAKAPKAKGTPTPTAVSGKVLSSDNPDLAPAVRDVLKKVEEAQTSVKDVQMDLKMTVQDLVSGQKQTFKGKVTIKQPDRVITHYTSPTEQFLYINGRSLMMYQPEQNMVYKKDAEKGRPPYLGVGQELKKYAKTSRVSIAKETSDRVVLLFVPNEGESQFNRMKVTVRKSDWWPETVEIQTSAMANKAQFLNPVFNQGLPDSQFKFTPPPGASVVEGEIF